MNVDRHVHRDIENALPDNVTRKLSLVAIAWYRLVYGDRTDKEYAVCAEVQGMDLWCIVRRHGPGEWEVLMLPDKEAQEYMQDWEDEFPPKPIPQRLGDAVLQGVEEFLKKQ